MKSINGHTKTLGLIGYPVGHTLSPVIHNYLAEKYGQELVYVPLPVEPGKLEDALKGAAAFGFPGMNVTVPYKNDVIPLCMEVDELAAKIGSVNTLVWNGMGYKGYNTDVTGLYRAMTEDGVAIEGENVVILGAGGVSRTVAYLMADKKAKHVYLMNRTFEKAAQLAEHVNKDFRQELITPLAYEDHKMLPEGDYLAIQATSLGMSPRTEGVAIEDAEFYRKIKCGYEIIFNPAKTRFMKLVEEAGGVAYNGLKMLLYQGIDAYELWNPVKISREDIEALYEIMKETLGL
ncbi:MAG: shikimate dehydrogenase [Lachnospiraceae bacterium]|nr:shikimate dehydrogenase [Lachnospiraceae bacterium]